MYTTIVFPKYFFTWSPTLKRSETASAPHSINMLSKQCDFKSLRHLKPFSEIFDSRNGQRKIFPHFLSGEKGVRASDLGPSGNQATILSPLLTLASSLGFHSNKTNKRFPFISYKFYLGSLKWLEIMMQRVPVAAGQMTVDLEGSHIPVHAFQVLRHFHPTNTWPNGRCVEWLSTVTVLKKSHYQYDKHLPKLNLKTAIASAVHKALHSTLQPYVWSPDMKNSSSVEKRRLTTHITTGKDFTLHSHWWEKLYKLY